LIRYKLVALAWFKLDIIFGFRSSRRENDYIMIVQSKPIFNIGEFTFTEITE